MLYDRWADADVDSGADIAHRCIIFQLGLINTDMNNKNHLVGQSTSADSDACCLMMSLCDKLCLN